MPPPGGEQARAGRVLDAAGRISRARWRALAATIGRLIITGATRGPTPPSAPPPWRQRGDMGKAARNDQGPSIRRSAAQPGAQWGAGADPRNAGVRAPS